MKRINFVLVLGFILILLGCEGDETIVNMQSPQENYSITVDGLPETIIAPSGVTREIPFYVSLRNAEGSVSSGVEVSLAVRRGSGTISPLTSTTDSNGRIEAFYSVAVPAGETTVQVAAAVDRIEVSRNIVLKGVNHPHTLRLITETNILALPDGQTGSIDINAVVADVNGASVPGTKLRYWLTPFGEGEIFGSITGDSYTGSDGRAKAVFSTDGGFGQILVQVAVDEVGIETERIENVYVTIENLRDLPRSLTISASPDRISPTRVDSTYTTLIRATVRDQNRVGIPNMMLNFGTDHGTLSRPHITDSSGTAVVLLSINPGVDFDLEGGMDESAARVTVSVPGTGWTAEARIDLILSGGDPGSLTLEQDKRFIWADGEGYSMAYLTAFLKDGDGQVLVGEEIVFTTSDHHSVVQSPVLTDSLGRARAVFDDTGRPSTNPVTGLPDSVTITARYDKTGLTKTVKIMIREGNPVATINVHANVRQLAANGDSVLVRVTAYLNDGSPAPNGIEAHAEAVYGRVNPETLILNGGFYYFPPARAVTDTIRVYVINIDGSIVYSNEELIDIVSGPPASISVRPTGPQSVMDGEQTTITAFVSDSSGNPARQGTYVSFMTTLGSIAPAAVTDEEGEAEVLFIGGPETGTALITATTDGPHGPLTATTTVEVVGGVANSMELLASPAQIQPDGSGGMATSVITAIMKDRNGNQVSGNHMVTFMLSHVPELPEGPDFDDQGQILTIDSQDGVARTWLNAGTEACSALIYAYTLSGNNGQDTVAAWTTVLISGGPAVGLDIDIDENAADAGGGAWELEVAVRVWDAMGNPVPNGTQVVFEMEPAGVLEPVVTGNFNRRGFVTSGTAYARLVYNSESTFEEVRILASVQSRAGLLTGEKEFQYPLQRGELMLNVDPENWMFNEDNPEATIRTWVVLRDGHGVLINNAPILFTSNRARFSWLDNSNDQLIQFFPAPALKYTGVVDRQNNEQPGQATVYLRASMDDIFLDPFTLEVTAQINATVEGYDDVFCEPRFVVFTRLAG